MTNKQFCEVWADAQTAEDRGTYVSDWSTSSLFVDPEDEAAEIDPALVEQLGQIWDVAHMTMAEIRATTGMTQAAWAERLCCPKRTVENWEYRCCPSHIKLMIAEQLGLIKR